MNYTLKKDLIGFAIETFFLKKSKANLYTETSISYKEKLPLAYFFRSFDKMPFMEQKALSLSQGKVLDVGCGAGSHTLYLQNKGLDVYAIDISPKCVNVCKSRRVNNVSAISFLDYNPKNNATFDTILLLMNGTGIFESVKKTGEYLQKIKSLLNKDGCAYIDSSDLKYMYDDMLPPFQKKYYGEIIFNTYYKNFKSKKFSWLYLDKDTFKKLANQNGFLFEVVENGDHFDYLAKLTKM